VRAGDFGESFQMPDVQSGLTRTAANLHRGMKATADAVGILLVDGFHYLALFAIGATTVWSALAAFVSMLSKGRAELSDILLLFIYLELGAMVGIYFKTTKLPVRYLIYIAMTALGRILIEVGGAEHKTGKDLLIVAGAIFVLSVAVLVLRFASDKDDPSDRSGHGRHLDQHVGPDEARNDAPILRK
jgi:protein PsiE